MVSGLTFRSFIHFEFIFYIDGVRKWSSFILLHVAVQFSQYHLMKRKCFFHFTEEDIHMVKKRMRRRGKMAEE